jgi:hypothetical protein
MNKPLVWRAHADEVGQFGQAQQIFLYLSMWSIEPILVAGWQLRRTLNESESLKRC